MRKIVLVALFVGCIAGSSALADLDRIICDGSWSRSTYNNNTYNDITDEPIALNRIWGANTGGGVDCILAAETVNLFGDATYTNLAEDGDNDVYATDAAGGLDHIYYSTAWERTSGFGGTSAVYNDVAVRPGSPYNQYWCTRQDGGIDLVYWYAGGSRWAYDRLWSGTTYEQIIVDSTNSNLLWAINAAGGVDSIYWTGTLWDIVNRNSSDDYTAIAQENDGTQQTYWLTRADGGLEVIYYASGWQTATLFSDTTYIDVAAHNSADMMWASRATGGIDKVYLSGTWQRANLFGDKVYGTIVGEPYTDLVYGGEVPEPATLAVLTLGGCLLALRKRRW